MSISETILAAGIGGAATVVAGLFQLYSALRVKGKADSRPKRTSMTRSMISIAALMATAAAGGYLFAEYRQQRALDEMHTLREELHGMRDELNARLQTLETVEHLAPEHGIAEPPAGVEAPAMIEIPAAARLALSEATSPPPPAAAP
jgi:hypothetical protein